jgi:S-adenosylmethionine:tRNA ribosyltransferase-isomerase
MDVREFHYNLPSRLIAQHPCEKRDHSRLMILDRRSGRITHRAFFEIVTELFPGDALVLNNTRVIKARLLGQKKSGGKVEVLLTNRIQSTSPHEEIWNCLVKTSKRLHPGTSFQIHPDLIGQTLAVSEGVWTIRLRSSGRLRSVLERVGQVPLPPYIKRSNGPDLHKDRERYQTVFAKHDGAIAAPTAGLHFTSSLISQIQRAGVSVLTLTLHIGVGTFLPVRADRIEDHHMHEEVFHIPRRTAETINRVKGRGGRIIAVGTSVTRALESAVDVQGRLVSGHGETSLFIYPPFRFRMVDGLVTNFHLPGSTLVMLVSAFAEKDLIFRAYEEAINQGYRFYSYGDAMMVV